MEDPVVKAAANCSGKGCVGAESVGVDVSGAKHRFGKRAHWPDRNGHTRTEKQIIDVRVHADRRARNSNGASTSRTGKFEIAVIGAEISNDTYEREELAFERSFPTVQALAISSDHIGVEIRVAGVNISAGGNLGGRQSRKRKQNEAENPTLAHNHPPSAWVTRMYAESCWMRGGVFG